MEVDEDDEPEEEVRLHCSLWPFDLKRTAGRQSHPPSSRRTSKWHPRPTPRDQDPTTTNQTEEDDDDEDFQG